MRVLIAPGPFGAALSAVESAEAIAVGWSRRSPDDNRVLAPVCDGGEGYVDALHASLGGQLVPVTVSDAFGRPTHGRLLLADGTAYVETAQAVSGRPLAPAEPERAGSAGVGELIAHAVALGATRVLVGVGTAGCVSNDGGAGLLGALGATSDPTGALVPGSLRLGGLDAVDLSPAVTLLSGVELVLVTDDDVPLLGLLGTTNTAGRGRGIEPARVTTVDALLERLAGRTGRRHALAKGAGSGGGIGFALMVLGASRVGGLASMFDEIGLAARMSAADLVVTGEQAFDFSPGSGRISTAVAALAGSVVRPCIALAGHVTVGARETRALGLESVYGARETLATLTDDPAADLAALAARVARTWSWSR